MKSTSKFTAFLNFVRDTICICKHNGKVLWITFIVLAFVLSVFELFASDSLKSGKTISATSSAAVNVIKFSLLVHYGARHVGLI